MKKFAHSFSAIAGILVLLALLMPSHNTVTYAAPAVATSTEPATLTPTNTTATTPPNATATTPPNATATTPPNATPTNTRVPATPRPEDPTNTPDVPPTATATTTPSVLIADPVITKRVNVNQAQVGDEAIFTLTVTNRGNVDATNVVVTDPMPAFLQVLSVSSSPRGTVSVSGNTVTVDLGSVAPGEVITITITTRIIASAAPPDNRNIASLTTTSTTDDPSNNTGTSEVVFGGGSPATPTNTPVPPKGSPIPAPPVPPSLPPTGAADDSRSIIVLLALGLMVLSALLHWRTRRMA